jgi:hypothetical protein
MAGKPTCLVCQKEMVRGFITDVTVGAIYVPRWCDGEPQSDRFGGTATGTQFKDGLKVVAFRCPECEALRLYAPSAE